MRVERALVGLLLAAMVAAPGCGRLAYNLPPASRLMEPGPGVGGPGPGVIPPAGSAYGMSGGAIGRFGDGQGSYAGGSGGYCAVAPQSRGGMVPAPTPNGVMQAGYGGECESCESGACPVRPAGPTSNGMVQQAGFHGMLGGACGGMRPGSMEAYADGCGGGGGGYAAATSQIAFLGEDGVQVSWDVSGSGQFDSSPLVIPGRQDFYQGAIYRLKLTNIPGRAGVNLYPTLEVAPVTPRTDAYLAHSPIPIQFTAEDFDQVVSGNFVTKVIYLPDPEFQELALAGVETLVSTRLDPGVDPIAEADRRGSILAVVRMGNKDLERTNTNTVQSEGETVVPAHHEAADDEAGNGDVSQAMYNEPAGEANSGNVQPVQYCEGGPGYGYGGGYGNASMGNMPMGMPTGGFAPPAVPPNMIAGAPQWGMPMSGTPIGLPGPPHVPLGTPAGLQKHVMKNRTRVCLPPPVVKMEQSVKQRPGMNYPRPVDHVCVDETQREPFRILPVWLTNAFSTGGAAGANAYHSGPVSGPCP